MVRKTKNPESDVLATRVQKILLLRSKWLQLTGGEPNRGIELLEQAGSGSATLEQARQKPRQGDADEAAHACFDAIEEWRKLNHDLIGWALAAKTSIFSKNWPDPDHNLPSNHARRHRLRWHLSEAIEPAADSDAYVIATVPKEIAIEALSALDKLGHGEVDSILQPTKKKNYKDGWTIPSFRQRIVCACHYCYGYGLSMAMARRHISGIVGEHFESIRNWDRAFLRKGFHGLYRIYRMDLIRYQIAGAVASGATYDDANRRLQLEAKLRSITAEPEGSSTFASSWWDQFLHEPLVWDDGYFRKLGQDYHRALRQQKQLARRR